MNSLIGNIKKFWCLEGFVAIIFSIFFARAAVVFFLWPSVWGALSAILMAIFSYWFVKRVLARPTPYNRGKTDWHGNRDIDI